jgi:S-DNA-T family DNA segregation ATPase FtsK/SpoIIIE
MRRQTSRLTVPLGTDTAGIMIFGDIARFPHVIIAGIMGSEVSSLLRTWICTLITRGTPADVGLVLIGTKQDEFAVYNGIPHMLTPAVADGQKAFYSLEWAMNEMEQRYQMLAGAGVKDIYGYNGLPDVHKLPYVLVIADEFSDFMAYEPGKIVDMVFKLALMARATGIHMILGTSKTTKDALHSKIVASFPVKIAFHLSKKKDSRYVSGREGAELLRGSGDMLYFNSDLPEPLRIQSPYISEKEIEIIVTHLADKHARR